jgi:nitrite reductase/ring-hydroxylating ferredoxin subunit
MPGNSCTSCNGCGATSRREFLRAASGAAAALSAVLGLEPVRALPVREGSAHTLELDGLRYAIPAADGAIIDRENEVILMRHKRRAYAFALSCPHQRTMLKWLPEQGRFQCPKHKSKYQPDGSFISGRATRAMDRHAIRLVGRELVVDPAVRYRSDRTATAWSAASVTLP